MSGMRSSLSAHFGLTWDKWASHDGNAVPNRLVPASRSSWALIGKFVLRLRHQVADHIGETDVPTVEAFVGALPAMVWPE